MRQWFLIGFAFCCALVTAGCRDCQGPLITDLVTIRYRQLFNFSQWEVRASDGSVFSQGNIVDGVFMRYRIVAISNKDSQPKPFRFDPNRIHTGETTERPSQPVIGLKGALAFDVAPGTVATDLNVTIKVAGNPDAIKSEIRLLQYDSAANEHVLMVNDAPNSTTVPFRSPLRIPAPDVN